MRACASRDPAHTLASGHLPPYRQASRPCLEHVQYRRFAYVLARLSHGESATARESSPRRRCTVRGARKIGTYDSGKIGACGGGARKARSEGIREERHTAAP
ncbi:MAG: hypothetical protein M1522_04215 [Actinobacteria bacterium]|nr:hypothetical protein [Actinomycetota bacterium]